MSGSFLESCRLGGDAIANDTGSTLLFMASTCRGKVCLNVAAVWELFAHDFHCLCHLLQKSYPDSSMLCPLLLHAQDQLVLYRDTVLQERPALPRDDRGKESCAVDAQVPRRGSTATTSVASRRLRQEKLCAGVRRLQGVFFDGAPSTHHNHVASARDTHSLQLGKSEHDQLPEESRRNAR